MKPIRTLALLSLVATLGACGLKGGLEKPPPQFGEAHRQYVAEQRAKAEAAAAEKARKEKERQTVTIPVTPPTTPPATPQ